MASTPLSRGWNKHVKSADCISPAHSTLAPRRIRTETEAQNRCLRNAIKSGIHPPSTPETTAREVEVVVQ